MIIYTLKVLTLQDCLDLYKDGIAVVYKGGKTVSFEILHDYGERKYPGHMVDGSGLGIV